MHFEVSDGQIRVWGRQGVLGGGLTEPAEILSLGDRGPDVRTLQEALQRAGAVIAVNGDFGRGTLAAVMAFQADHGLQVDGVVGRKTRQLLEM